MRPTARQQSSGGGVTFFARFQIILLCATVVLWYLISTAEHAISSSMGVHPHASFLSASSEDCGPASAGDPGKRVARQVQSASELRQPYELLTIAIDSRHSCPDLCTFVHPLLPAWVRYRQLHFEDEKDLAQKLSDDAGHVIVVARTNIINIANWAVKRRKKAADVGADLIPSTGLFHNADERFHKGEISGVYDKFDYVLRQYYRKDDDGKFHGYTLRALGNRTCGMDESLPLPELEGDGPRWGVYYVPLDAHTVDVHLNHHATSNYPTYLRPANCSFIGRSDVKRSLHERAAMKTAVEEHGAEMNCQVEFTSGFAAGKTKFEYFNYDIAMSKIGLSPRGSAIETHRLAELLQMGAVPAIVSEDYLFATFRPVPAIIGIDWPDVVGKMKKYLAEEKEVLESNSRDGGRKVSKLELLSRDGTRYYRDLKACMMADMDYILKGAFGRVSPKQNLR